MNINTKKTVITVVILIAIVAFGIVVKKNFVSKTSYKEIEAAQNSENKNEEANIPQNKQDAVTESVIKNADNKTNSNVQKLYKAIEGDIILGDENAPVVIVEYASLSCPHCATFHSEAMPKLKADYIDKGKVQFIHRDFPLNQQALTAAMVAICHAKDAKDNRIDYVATYYDFLKALFKTQEAWAFAPNFLEKLESIAKLDGMSGERFKACVNDSALQEKILNSRLEAAKILQIQSTPTFIINGETVSGYTGFSEVKKVIDKKLSSK